MRPSGFLKTPLVASVLMLGATTALTVADCGNALAQTETAQSKSRFDISAGSLSDALVVFSAQSRFQITSQAPALAGHRTNGLHGNFTANEALARLLQGSGLSWRSVGSSAIQIVPATRSAAITLGPVRVGGMATRMSNPQAPYGPGEGFFVSHSTAATKTDTAIVDIPQSVYVIGRQQMDDLQPLSVDEVLRYMPGITDPMGGSGIPSINSHDIYQRGFQTDTFVDGLMTGVSPSTVEPFMLDRVEAMSGPASVMYGQAAPGGIINEDLKRPTEQAQHQFNVGFGSYGRYEGQFDSSGPLTKDGQLLYRIVAVGNTQGDQVQYVKYKRMVIQPALTWNIDKNTKLTLIGQYNYTPSLRYAAGAPAIGSLFPQKYGRYSPTVDTGDPGFDRSYDKSHLFEYIFSHKFNRYLQFSQNFRYEYDDSYFAQLFSSGIVAGTSNMKRYALVDHFKGWAALLDSHLQGDYDTGPIHHTLLVGVDYRDQPDSGTYAFDFSTVPTLNLLSPKYYQYNYSDFIKQTGNKWYTENDSLSQTGVYFQDQMKWKGLSVMIGSRQDWDDYYSTFKKAFTWHVGVSYKTKFGLAPYFSYATSFFPQTSNIYGKGIADPLEGKQWEVGLKYQPTNTKMLFTAAAYDMKENNVLESDPDHANFYLEIGQVRARGVELSANVNITQGLNLNANYTYMSIYNSHTTLTSTDISGKTVSLQGKSPTELPRNTFNLFVNYKFQKNTLDGILDGLSLNAGMRYVGFSMGDQANSFHVPAYTVFDGGMSYDFGKLSRRLKGLNVRASLVNGFNKQYVVECSSSTSCAWGQLRRVTGQIGYRW
ncbi:TonB-dependent siderophore receptor [Gluconobacter oxydans]|uniref:TonB-dependent siderophore receptor n=1 Tax=Gluconobacter oxydans TaxID=442 RepID=UPI00062C8A0C|nr:TonB-dependent siderophore receptor [Gluconobacter oxydans]